MKENFGLLNSPESFRLAEEKVEKYNEKMGDEFAKVVQKDSGEFMIVVCDSLSRRVSEYVPQSGDILFMDATSNSDRGDSKFFRLITPSSNGQNHNIGCHWDVFHPFHAKLLFFGGHAF